MDLYVLNKNLEIIGIIDTYKSLIWSNRYKENGDCEVYVEANTSNLSLLQKGNYLVRSDDEMVCRINKIELQTDVENGNYLIVTGVDTKAYLDQRIIWDTMTCDGNIEDFIRAIVNSTLIDATLSDRNLLKPNGDALLSLGDKANLTEVTTEQVTYTNVGEKIREYCDTYLWGYRFILDGSALVFELYKGEDRSDTVVFSNAYDNLIKTDYIDDASNLGNVALVGGEGEGSERKRNVSGSGESTDRYEIFVDAKDISKTITYEELTTMYPLTSAGGQGQIVSVSGGYAYKLNYLNIQVVDDAQLAQLETKYPTGQEVTIDDNLYYQVYNVNVASVPSNAPEESDNVELYDVIYEVYLLTRGYEKLAEYGEKVTFNGTIEPNTTFVYKRDYNLGDIVTIENEYGISIEARITEIIEVYDENGYSVEPKFEYKNMEV